MKDQPERGTETNGNENAGFWIRLGASLLDSLIVALPISLLFMLFTGRDFGDDFISNLLMFLYSLLVPVFWYGYTVGKRICGIRIVKVSDGQPPGVGTMLLRTLVAGLVYAITLGVGAIASAIRVGVREDKRSIHDFIAGTGVIKE
ncbi:MULTISPECIES: RDD family protein [Paenibacillus]|uniref:RDD family protein n=1 Tax=Paenibacillus TaxID=44249 RepID=UPI00065FEE6C|nr:MULTISPECIES: RDD family protein [Paenibacillus]